MTILQWFIFFLVIQIIHYLGTWKLYEKAGRKSWEAAIPVYNAIILMKIINRPTWWTALLFVPVINVFMFIVVWVETARSFGKNTTKDTLLVIFTLGFYIYYLNYVENVVYKRDRSLVAATKAGDTISSLLFAIIVATLVHTYVIQPFNIPTSSLEKSLLVGDFLFVSKFHYGAKTPKTAVAIPMVHDSIPFVRLSDSIPFLNGRSYLRHPQYPSFRLPGLQEIKRNDIVVFNWPVDTVYKFRDKSGKHVYKPVDKKSNYVKRCVGIPGDNLSVKDGDVYINNKKLILPTRAKLQYLHKVYAKNGVPLEEIKKTGSTEYQRSFVVFLSDDSQRNAVSPYVRDFYKNKDGSITVKTDEKGIPLEIIKASNISITEVYDTVNLANLTFEGAKTLRNSSDIDSVIKLNIPKQKNKEIFPHNTNWTVDNYGPIYIPHAGKTLALTKENLSLYKRIIKEYEGNTLVEKGGQILINDKPTTSYTFKQDYYWMMGDNRQTSEDSRYWGFVPFDHVVGKPVFIWWSIDQNIPWSQAIDKVRWERLFCTVGGDGEPKSYFVYFLIALVGWFGFDFYRKKKKA